MPIQACELRKNERELLCARLKIILEAIQKVLHNLARRSRSEQLRIQQNKPEQKLSLD